VDVDVSNQSAPLDNEQQVGKSSTRRRSKCKRLRESNSRKCVYYLI